MSPVMPWAGNWSDFLPYEDEFAQEEGKVTSYARHVKSKCEGFAKMQVCAKEYRACISRTVEAVGLFEARKTHDQFRFCKDGYGCRVKKNLESSEGCKRPFRRPLPSFW